MSLYTSTTWRSLYCVAALSGGCAAEDAREQEQASTAKDSGIDAGDPQRARMIAEFDEWIKARDAVYCDPKLDVVCTFEEPGSDYCDFDATVASRCRIDSEFTATKNDCGGVTLGSSGPFGGQRWHYNDKSELIGAAVSADQTSYCGKTGVRVGTQCGVTSEKINLCTDHDD